jgi:DNA modification methylase
LARKVSSPVSTNPIGLRIEMLATDRLVPDPGNPRQHSPSQIRQIARSIATFGFCVPVLVDSDDKIIAGHGRVLGAREIGYPQVPVIRLGHLTSAQAKAFAIADNRLNEVSTWDRRLLGEVFSGLTALDLDFSLEVTGFSMAEIDLTIEDLTVHTGDGPDAADDLAGLVTNAPVTRPGDLWRLGPHRLLCADAVDPASHDALLEGRLAQAVFTDPPYNVAIDGHVSGKGKIHHREFAMASGEMSDERFAALLTSILSNLARHSAPGSLHYVCMDWRHLGVLLRAGEQTSRELINICVWTKHNAGMGSFYRSQHEFVVVFRNGAARHRNNIQLGRFGRNRTNVWSYPGINDFGRGGDEGNLLALHPTVKPVALVADAILDCTARGDIVLDPFLGSGSSLIAAQRVGRVCLGMEIDPLYVDTAVRRWQRFTGDTAIHAESGRPFEAIASDEEAGR